MHEKASDSYQKNNLWKSIMYCDEAIKEDSNFLLPYILKADVLSDLGNWDKATENYEKAIELSPEFDPMLIYFTGNAYFEQEN